MMTSLFQDRSQLLHDRSTRTLSHYTNDLLLRGTGFDFFLTHVCTSFDLSSFHSALPFLYTRCNVKRKSAYDKRNHHLLSNIDPSIQPRKIEMISIERFFLKTKKNDTSQIHFQFEKDRFLE